MTSLSTIEEERSEDLLEYETAGRFHELCKRVRDAMVEGETEDDKCPLLEYLRLTVTKVPRVNNYIKVKVVMGNESCDLDSAVSALVYAYLCFEEMRTRRGRGVFPVLNVSRSDLGLKTEVLFWLKKFGITEDLLITRSEIDLKFLHENRKLHLILVDHHILSKEDSFMKNSIFRIFDHRPPAVNFRQKYYWNWPGRNVIMKVGSCATLIAIEVLKSEPHLLTPDLSLFLYVRLQKYSIWICLPYSSSSARQCPSCWCVVGYQSFRDQPDFQPSSRGPILLDTACLSPDSGRTTQTDLYIVSELDKRLQNTVDHKAIFEMLVKARSDISSLTPSQLLIKDLKVVNGIPISGLPILVQEFVELSGVKNALKEFCAARKSSTMMILGLKLDQDNIYRDLSVFSPRKSKVGQQLIDHLKKSRTPSLLLTPVILSDDLKIPGLSIFQQGNIKASRKEIVPLVQAAIKSILTLHEEQQAKTKKERHGAK